MNIWSITLGLNEGTVTHSEPCEHCVVNYLAKWLMELFAKNLLGHREGVARVFKLCAGCMSYLYTLRCRCLSIQLLQQCGLLLGRRVRYREMAHESRAVTQ